MFWDQIWHAVVRTAIFSSLGIIMFGVSFALLAKVLPFSLHKELEEDQNTAMGIVVGAIILGIALIIGFCITGD